jgi:ABC-type transport system involved in cytochrome c biogenesis permease subunit
MKPALSLIAAAVVLTLVAFTWREPRNQTEYHLSAMGRQPVLVDGRIKPFDTVARSSLLMIQGRQRVLLASGQVLSPVEWLLDMFFRPTTADNYQVFEIVHPEVLALMDLAISDGEGGKRFSAHQLSHHLAELDRQAKLADDTETPLRSSFQRAVVQLRDHVMLYQRLQSTFVPPGSDDFLVRLGKIEADFPAAAAVLKMQKPAELHDSPIAKLVLNLGREFVTMDTYSYLRPIPPVDPANAQGWTTVGAAWTESLGAGKVRAVVSAYLGVALGWHDHQPELFNRAAGELDSVTHGLNGAIATRCLLETRFNAAQPFYTSMALYLTAFLLGVFSWLKWPNTLRQLAFGLTAAAFIITTAGIGIRMWLEARPPVTNLYSSALFVGWGAVLLCLILEGFYRNAIGSVAAGLIGFATLLVAHHLALGGDTLEMMRAVLDSNLWLATHVVTIAIGYSATFLAGFLALIYVLRGVMTKTLDQVTADSLSRMIYGILCFATLFSLVGTVLGGIWADQSWGRFWGWDPKENGALLIVMWNSILLHARWGGLVKQRGLAMLAIFGNIVTAWSWFGVNMLGVGLHSYGFMDSAFWWLIAFVISQVAIILLAAIPRTKWRSA